MLTDPGCSRSPAGQELGGGQNRQLDKKQRVERRHHGQCHGTYDALQAFLSDGEELLIGLDAEVTQGSDQVTHIHAQGNQVI